MGKGGGGTTTAAEPEKNEDGSLKNPNYYQKADAVNYRSPTRNEEHLPWSPYDKKEIDRRYSNEQRLKKLEDSLLKEDEDPGKEAITNDLGRPMIG